MPSISIITTSYKHQDFIAQTIESVLAQTFTDRELLIGDDSPDDATWNIIQDYVKKYPKKIKARHHNPNKGIVENMNFIYRQCNPSSTYISFLEGDDRYVKNNIEEKIKIFENNATIDLVSTAYKLIDQRGLYMQGGKDFTNDKDKIMQHSLESLLKRGNPIHSFSAVILKKTIADTVFPLSGPPNTHDSMFGPLDYWIWTVLLPHVTSYHSSKILLEYRRQENNFTKQVKKFNTQLNTIYEYYKNMYPQNTHLQDICHNYIITNEVIGNMFVHHTSFGYIWKHRKRITLGTCFKLSMMSTLGILPGFMFDNLLGLFNRIKYRNA